MKNDWLRLLGFLEGKGYRAKIVPIGRIEDIQEMIETRRARGELDETLDREQLREFTFEPPPGSSALASLIIVAVPVPMHQVTFIWEGRELAAVLPPTYVRYRATIKRVQDEIAAFAGPFGHETAPAALPLKSLAVGCGLGTYGKNNLCYVPGMGSFLQLVGAYSTVREPADEWPGPRMLPRCEKCEACRRSCPTGAIREDRFLIAAERCLTFHNERHQDFPEWIDPSWHNALVGCMKCQSICPENTPFRDWIEPGVEFNECETRLFLSGSGTGMGDLPAETEAKIKRLGLTESWTLMCRNLAALVRARTAEANEQGRR